MFPPYLKVTATEHWFQFFSASLETQTSSSSENDWPRLGSPGVGVCSVHAFACQDKNSPCCRSGGIFLSILRVFEASVHSNNGKSSRRVHRGKATASVQRRKKC